MFRSGIAVLSACLVLSTAAATSAGIHAGRFIDGSKTFSTRLSLNQFDGIAGEVRETKRAGTDAVTDEGRYLETYTFEELGFAEGYTAFGLDLEKHWKYITLQFDAKYAAIEGSSVARRIYAIGLSEVQHNGREYEYMLIPKGQRFETEMDALFVDLRFKITPFHLTSEDRWVDFSPWILGGLYAVGATYTIDAGPSRGITTYEIDPYPYVVGGKGEGEAGAFLPQIGFGGELRLGLWEMANDRAELALQAEYSFLELVARTGDFGVSARNEKNIDTSYSCLDLRAQLELPMSESKDFLIGAGMTSVSVEAEISADRTPPNRRTTEKYDKYASMEMDWYYVFAGIKF